MSRPSLPRSTPAAAGVSASGIEAFLDAIEAAPTVALHSLMILRRGQVVAEGWWAPYRPDDVHLLYSISKSFTSTALGFALAEGRLALDDTVVQHFPALDPGPSAPRARAITVEHLARMATGHHADILDTMEGLDPAEPVSGFLRIEPESAPGSVFAYNNGATYVLGAIVQERTGQSLTEYLQPRLFEPLGIRPPHWDTLNGRRQMGYSGLHLRTEELARFGQLYLAQGSWAGSELLSPSWVAEATRAHTATPGEPEPDWRRGYGYQFWRSRHGYRGDGAYGQFCLVLPEQDAVVVTTGETETMQTVLDAVWAHLVPAFDQPSAAGDDDRLASRLASLALPAESAGTYPGDDRVTASGLTEQPSGWVLTLTFKGDDPLEPPRGSAAGDTADHQMEIRCGDQQWRRTSVPVRNGQGLVIEAQGRWTDPETFTAELILVHTPHRMTVSYTPRTGSSSARWRSVPLGATSLVTPLSAD
ncbi:MAG TPA: serine hydrolase domain-containing protein [Propionibacteriaceae bacterium]|nr:serine hydrolase domain-containing protein [Propionibacteriaceae bacterium]